VSEENKRVQRRVIEEVFNRGDLDLVDELFSQNHVQHDPSGPQVGQGTEEFKGTVSAIRAAFPDLHMQIEDHIAEGDRVVTRWVGSGTHRGDFMGVPPHRQPGEHDGDGHRPLRRWQDRGKLEPLRCARNADADGSQVKGGGAANDTSRTRL
jgi:steroid delta-isomerase-like uncharacterized protein